MTSAADDGDSAATAQAYLAWIRAVGADSEGQQGIVYSHSVEKVEDLCDGLVLFDIMSSIDAEHFSNPHSAGGSDSWAVKVGSLKRLYKLIMQYYASQYNVQPSFDPPNLDAIASTASLSDLCSLCQLVLGLAVKGPRGDDHVAAISTLPQEVQASIMEVLTPVMAVLEAGAQPGADDGEAATNKGTSTSLADEAEAAIAPEAHRRLLDEKAALEKSYLDLMEANRTLTANVEDTTAERDEAKLELTNLRDEVEASKKDGTEALLRADVQRLKAELRRSEDNLAEAESEVERMAKAAAESTRKIEELQKKADEGAKLKDQVDEYRHAADKLQRMENVVEKYKKKLEESADVRRQLKTLEDQNAELVDKNAALEDEYKRVANFKPLMDSYKSQISELEAKASGLQRDLNASRYDHERTTATLRAAEEARAREKEELELYQERIHELELGTEGGSKRAKRAAAEAGAVAEGAEGLAAANDVSLDEDEENEDEEEDEAGGELGNALSGTTMTDLKIRVRKLMRQLEAAQANKADVSRILVLENLLDDALRMKARYEQDYLAEHQAKLKLQANLEAIQNGKSNLGDGAEAAYALRLRLNETVEELDQLKLSHSALEVAHEAQLRELNIAKSDLSLVNKDQIDIVRSLRDSVNVEKAGLEAVVERLREQVKSAEEQNRMQMGQINSLLMEKVDLQSEGIGQREEALKRERNLGELRASLAGKALPKEAEDMLLGLQSNIAALEKDVKAYKDKLSAARKLIKEQDRRIKAGPSDEQSAQATVALEEQIAILRRELRLMASAYHDQGQQLAAHLRARNRTTSGGGMSSGSSASQAPASWLVQQRRALTAGIQLARR